MLFITCQPSNRLSIFLSPEFLSPLNKSASHSAQIYCYKVLKRIMNLELAVSFPVNFNEYHIWSMTNCWTHSNRGPFNPYSAVAPSPPKFTVGKKEKPLIFAIKKRRIPFPFLSFFLSSTPSDADENAFRGFFFPLSTQQKLSIQPDNRIKRRISRGLIFRD